MKAIISFMILFEGYQWSSPRFYRWENWKMGRLCGLLKDMQLVNNKINLELSSISTKPTSTQLHVIWYIKIFNVFIKRHGWDTHSLVTLKGRKKQKKCINIDLFILLNLRQGYLKHTNDLQWLFFQKVKPFRQSLLNRSLY